MYPEYRQLSFGRLLKPYAGFLILGVLAVLAEGAANLAEPWPLKIVLDAVLKSKPAPPLLNHLVLFIGGAYKVAILNLTAVAVLLIAAVGAACNYIERYITLTVGQSIAHDLRQRLYFHLQHLSLGFHDRKQTGDIVSRLTTDIDGVQSFIATGMLGSLINVLTLLGMLAVMLFLSGQFTIIALSVAPPLFAVVFHYTRRVKEATREARRKEGEIASLIQEVLASMRVVKAFAREDYEQHRLAAKSCESMEIGLKVRSLRVKLWPMVDMIIAAGTSLVLWFGGSQALIGKLSTGTLVLFIWYLGRMYKPMRDLAKATDSYTRASVGYERIQEVLRVNRGVNDLPGARPAPRLQGRITFENVTFAYAPNLPVLKQVNLTVEPGQVAALVGRTGAGKSTIVNLIARFYDPHSGVVKIDGIDVTRFQQKSLRRQISFVLQDTMLFQGPIWYNIAYGRPDATSAEIVQAAHLANAHQFIEELPDGYETVIGERGLTLSGGQRQRIAIARAVVCDAPILILDEPSTGLDAASERVVLEALARLMTGRTVIVIAHKIETIRAADVIFVVDNGKVVERGSHSELIRAGGLYTKFHELQFRFDNVPA